MVQPLIVITKNVIIMQKNVLHEKTHLFLFYTPQKISIVLLSDIFFPFYLKYIIENEV